MKKVLTKNPMEGSRRGCQRYAMMMKNISLNFGQILQN